MSPGHPGTRAASAFQKIFIYSIRRPRPGARKAPSPAHPRRGDLSSSLITQGCLLNGAILKLLTLPLEGGPEQRGPRKAALPGGRDAPARQLRSPLNELFCGDNRLAQKHYRRHFTANTVPSRTVTCFTDNSVPDGFLCCCCFFHLKNSKQFEQN